jgi:phosphohistidine phosphatase
MKQLIILRHGKAERPTTGIDDYDRPLTDCGRKNASDMGTFISKRGNIPDLILSSSARRAHDTAILAAQSLGYPQEKIITNRDFYYAPPRWLLNEISKLPDEANCCLYVGHNPCITELINDLGLCLDDLPTASAACFEFPVDAWADILTGKVAFLWLKLAKEL